MGVEVQATEEKNAPAVTDDLLKELEANPRKIHTLEPALRDAVLKRIQDGADGEEEEKKDDDGSDEGTGDEDEAEKDGDKKGDKDDAEEDDKSDDAKTEKPDEKLTNSELRDKIRTTANEAHRLEQKLAAQKARKERAEAAYKKAKEEGGTLPEDVFEEEKVRGLYNELTETKARLARLEALRDDESADEEARVQQDLDRARQNSVFAEFEELQDRYPDLRTTKPIAEINAEYARALDSIVETQGLKAANPDATAQQLREKAIAWYNGADEATRAAVKVPFPEEMEQLGLALELWNAKHTHGGTLRGHYLQKLEDSGTLKDVVQANSTNAAKKAARETIKAVKEQDTELKTIGPGDGNHDGYTDTKKQTVEQAQAVLKRLNPKAGRMSTAEKAEHEAALRTLSDAAAAG